MKIRINLVLNQEPTKALLQWVISLISYNFSFVNTGGIVHERQISIANGQEIYPLFDYDTNQF